MTHNANHVTDHNELRTAIATELGRFGLGNTMGGPWNPGDPDHVGRHNAMVDALAAVATAAGRTYTTPLPPHRALGQTGHIGDHDGMRAAVVEAATWPAWNAATGGTIEDIPNHEGTGETWRVHTFTSAGTFTVASATRTFKVLAAAGGGGGGYGSPNQHEGGGGGAGGVLQDTLTLPPGDYPAAVGGGGRGGNGGTMRNGAKGGNTTFATLACEGGGFGAGNNNPGGSGGSGGGGDGGWGATAGGKGTVGPPRQGYDGANGGWQSLQAGGGGGATGPGSNANGGPGLSFAAGVWAVAPVVVGKGGRGVNATPADGYGSGGGGKSDGNAADGSGGVTKIKYRIG